MHDEGNVVYEFTLPVIVSRFTYCLLPDSTKVTVEESGEKAIML